VVVEEEFMETPEVQENQEEMADLVVEPVVEMAAPLLEEQEIHHQYHHRKVIMVGLVGMLHHMVAVVGEDLVLSDLTHHLEQGDLVVMEQHLPSPEHQ